VLFSQRGEGGVAVLPCVISFEMNAPDVPSKRWLHEAGGKACEVVLGRFSDQQSAKVLSILERKVSVPSEKRVGSLPTGHDATSSNNKFS